MMQSQLLGHGAIVDAGVLQRLKEKEQQTEDHQTLQARIIQLEGQVRERCCSDEKENIGTAFFRKK